MKKFIFFILVIILIAIGAYAYFYWKALQTTPPVSTHEIVYPPKPVREQPVDAVAPSPVKEPVQEPKRTPSRRDARPMPRVETNVIIPPLEMDSSDFRPRSDFGVPMDPHGRGEAPVEALPPTEFLPSGDGLTANP